MSVPVVTYERISADTARDEHGVENQGRENARTAERLGWTIVASFRDNDLTATKASLVRPGFDALARALALGRTEDGQPVSGLVAVALDRLARRFADWERLTDALTAEPGRVIALAGQSKDPYSEGFLWEGAAGMVGAKSEPRKIAERTTRSHRHRAERGQPVGGTRPFGWCADRRSLDPTEAVWARRAIEGWLSGRSLNSICLELRGAGSKTALGNEWTTTSLKVWLQNPRLCGHRKLRGEIVRESDGEPVIGQWGTLCTPAEFAAVSDRFRAREGTGVFQRGELAEARHLLTGLARCGKPGPDGTPCLSALRVARPKDMGVHIYTCRPKTSGGCGGVGRRGPDLELFVTEAVLVRLERQALQGRRADAWAKNGEYESALSRRAALAAAWQSGSITDDLFFGQVSELEAAIRSLRTEKERWEAALVAAQQTPRNVREEWDRRAGPEGISWRRSVLSRALNAVIVSPIGKGRHATFKADAVRLVWREA